MVPRNAIITVSPIAQATSPWCQTLLVQKSCHIDAAAPGCVTAASRSPQDSGCHLLSRVKKNSSHPAERRNTSVLDFVTAIRDPRSSVSPTRVFDAEIQLGSGPGGASSTMPSSVVAILSVP